MTASLEVAWAAANPIKGWFSREEAELLFTCASQAGSDTVIVEVGSYLGRSTVLLAHSGKRILAVDPLKSGRFEADNMTVTEDDIQQFERNIASHPNITWIRERSDLVPKPAAPIGLLLVDGSHAYPSPLKDYAHFEPWLSQDAFIAFHDYEMFDGVDRTVHELVDSGRIVPHARAGSLYVARTPSGKIKPSMPAVPKPVISVGIPSDKGSVRTKVTGFSLYMLCHMFGRRGRAMARSLASQSANSPPLSLTVFYNRKEDARLIVEGASEGERPPCVNLIHVASDRIMQRALHFMTAGEAKDYSHTVFLDADLWFPDDFWGEFASAVAQEIRGYWSCYVKNVPLAASESILVDWRSMNAESLERASAGFRHESWKGAVGHFQCVPTGFLQYPEDEIKAVNRADEVFAKAAIAVSRDSRPERRLGRLAAFHLDHPRCWEGSRDQL